LLSASFRARDGPSRLDCALRGHSYGSRPELTVALMAGNYQSPGLLRMNNDMASLPGRLAAVADTSISGTRVARELDPLIVSDNGPGADLTCDPGVDQPCPPPLALRRARQAAAESLRREFHRFIGRQRDELLNKEIFANLAHARRLLERWRLDYNQVRPHSAHRGGLSPAKARTARRGRPGLVDGPARHPLAPSATPAINPNHSPHERGSSGEQVSSSRRDSAPSGRKLNLWC
jgi:hypothetical protein